MILTLNPLPSRKARVWLDELPAASYEEESRVEKVISADRAISVVTTLVAAEILVQTGGRALYGLLGAEFLPTDSDRLRLKVIVSRFEGPPFASPIALPPPSDEIRIGLPGDYAFSVIDGALAAGQQLAGLPPGELLFKCAAHGLAGSSRQIFKALGQAVVKIQTLNRSTTLEQNLADVLKAQL